MTLQTTEAIIKCYRRKRDDATSSVKAEEELSSVLKNRLSFNRQKQGWQMCLWPKKIREQRMQNENYTLKPSTSPAGVRAEYKKHFYILPES